jgi:hypothetical protein
MTALRNRQSLCRYPRRYPWRIRRFANVEQALAIPAGFEPATLCLEGREIANENSSHSEVSRRVHGMEHQ